MRAERLAEERLRRGDATTRPKEKVDALSELVDNPRHDRGVRNVEPALGHHGHGVALAEAVGDVPADAELNDFRFEPTSAINGVAGNGFRHGHSEEEPDSPTVPQMHQNRESLGSA